MKRRINSTGYPFIVLGLLFLMSVWSLMTLSAAQSQVLRSKTSPDTSAVQVLNSEDNYFLKVDLDDPRVHVKTMVANNDVGGYQFLNGMSSTLSGQGYVEWALVNADLFSTIGCPSNLNCGQGLTYISNINRTNTTTYGTTWPVRGNIGFDDARNPEISVGGGQTKHYMVVAGGPRIVMGGGAPTCQGQVELVNGETKTFFPASGEWFDLDVTDWCTNPNMEISAVGISQDGRYLFFGMSTSGKTIIQLAQWLKDQGAYEVLRFDSRTSSGMYHFEGGSMRFSNNSGGAIANALAIGVVDAPPPCNPNADQVSLYTGTGFSGQCITKGLGDYPNPTAIGLPNDSIKSVKVGGNVKVQLCQHDNYGEPCSTFESDNGDIGGSGVGYGTSSAKVENRTCEVGGHEVALFPETNYGGQCYKRGPGQYTRWEDLGIGNDTARSIKVGSEVHVTLCSDGDYGGNCRWFDSDDPDLSNDGFVGSAGVSSMRVMSDQYNCSAGDWQIALFLDPNYGGLCMTLDVGEYPKPAYIGLPNDRISSIKVGDNVRGILCRGDNYSEPPCEEFDASDSNLSDNLVGDDSVSSVKVVERPTELPDLTSYAPEGYEYEVVPSSYGGTHSLNVLYSGVPTYFDWHFKNIGPVAVWSSFRVEIWLDDIKLTDRTFGFTASGESFGGDDLKGVAPSPGWHKVRLVIDPDNAIHELREDNNVWEHDFHWNAVSGWWGEYFANTSLSGVPIFARDDPGSDHHYSVNWGNGSPDPVVPADNFSVRWTRMAFFDSSNYEFIFRADGARVKIDGETVFERWPAEPDADGFVLPMTSGQHQVEFEVYEGTGEAFASLHSYAAPTLYEIDNDDGDKNYRVQWASFPNTASYSLMTEINGVGWYITSDITGTFADRTVYSPGQYCHRVVAWDSNGTPSGKSNIECTIVTSGPSDLPDLAPLSLDDPGYPVVPSSVVGTIIYAPPLYAQVPTYFDQHITNLGGAPGGQQWTSFEVLIDDSDSRWWHLSTPNSGETSSFYDWFMHTLTPGEHKVTFIVDPDNWVQESNESNNVWEGTFNWQPVVGWWGEYFANPDLSGYPVFVRDDENIDFNWGTNSPAPQLPPDNFSARWTRTLYYAAGTYHCSVTRDDGVRLYVDGDVIFDRWEPGDETNVFDLTMTDGWHEFQLEYFEAYEGARVYLVCEQSPPPGNRLYLPAVKSSNQ